MSTSFKIHTKEVKRAAKRKNLEIKAGITVEYDTELGDYNNKSGMYDDIVSERYSCPIGALYCDNKNVDVNDIDQLVNADDEAIKWGKKKFGKHYVDGFIMGFDNGWEYEGFRDYIQHDFYASQYEVLNSKQRKQWKAGFINGRLMHRYLLGE